MKALAAAGPSSRSSPPIGPAQRSDPSDAHKQRDYRWIYRKQLAVLRDAGTALALAFSPDDKMLASGRVDNSVRLWDLATRRHVAVLQVQAGVPGIILSLVQAVAFSSDGKTLAAAGMDGTVSLWDPTIRTQLAALHGHRGTALALAFSPNGKVLASAENDGRAMRLWDSASRKQLAVLHARAKAVAFSRDSKMLASVGRDSTVRLRSPATGKQPAALDGHALADGRLEPPFVSVAFSPDRTTLASASGDTVRFVGPRQPYAAGRSAPRIRLLRCVQPRQQDACDGERLKHRQSVGSRHREAARRAARPVAPVTNATLPSKRSITGSP